MPLSTAVFILWGAFWLYWLIAAIDTKHGSRGARARLPGLTVVVLLVLARVVGSRHLQVHSLVLQVVGVVLLLAGLGLAVWARIYLGRNWGMPMTRMDEPELVTSGPYRFVRHPIYSGLLLGLLGTAVAISPYFLIAVLATGAYFIYSARVEERILAESFPEAYSSYKARTKMLIPFVL
jgi:protein-S-isoprenylcysteine O-methyltransferase Ste14